MILLRNLPSVHLDDPGLLDFIISIVQKVINNYITFSSYLRLKANVKFKKVLRAGFDVLKCLYATVKTQIYFFYLYRGIRKPESIHI